MQNTLDNTEELCKVGDTLYRICKDGIIPIVITKIEHYPHCVYKATKCSDSFFNRAFGKTIFKTFEEANEMMQMKNSINKKRQILKEYEKKLNEKLKIKNHYIIK